MKTIAILLLLINIMAPCLASAGEFSSLAAGTLALRRRPKPGPVIPKPVSDICENCNGVGKVGDGTIMLTCKECGGSGKKAGSGGFPDDPPPAPPEPKVIIIYRDEQPAEPPQPAAPPRAGTCRVNADGTTTCSPATSRSRFGWRLR